MMGIKKKTTLNLSWEHILKIKPMIWDKGSTEKRIKFCAVICDKPYSENEYIRDYEKFKKLISLSL